MNAQATVADVATHTPEVATRTLPNFLRFRHVLLFFAVTLVSNFIAMHFVTRALIAGRPTGQLFVAGVMGFFVGQCIVLTVFGGLYGTSWVDGFWVGCWVAGTALTLIILVEFTRGTTPEAEMWSTLLLVPGAVFAAYSPMLLMRHFARWRLLVPGRSYLELPSGLSNIFINTAVIAGILVALRGPQVAIGIKPIEFWLACLAFGGVTAIIAAIVTIPLAATVNRKYAGQRIVRVGALALAGTVAFSFMAWLTATGPPNFYVQIVIAAVVATITMFIGFTAIRRDGLRLHTRTTERKRTADELVQGSQPSEVALQRYQKRTIWSVGLWLVGVIGLSILVAQFDGKRQLFDQTMVELEELVGTADGNISHYGYGHSIFGSLHTANPEQVQKLLGPLIETNTSIQGLDLSGCDIDDSCLTQIGQLKGLVRLTLNDTKVTGERFSKLSDLSFAVFQLKQLDLTQADWMALPTSKLSELRVTGSQLTQTEFVKFLKTTNLFTLNVGEMEVSNELRAEILRQAEGRLRRLELAGSNVDDQFVSRLKRYEISYLDLSRTNVTDGVFGSLGAMMPELTKLVLSGTAVTDDGIAKLAKHWPFTEPTTSNSRRGPNMIDFGSSLNLADTNVTGAFLVDWDGHIPQQLNLSGTKVDDTFVDLLPDGCSIKWLDLSNTKITDAILPKLAQQNFPYVSIKDTNLTAKALIQANTNAAKLGLGVGVETWYISPGQFTANEMKQFKKAGVPVR